MLISIVVPAFNEEENIPEFYEAIKTVMEQTPYSWEVVFCDDGSRDRTAEVALRLRQEDPRVLLVQLSRNFGSYSAISAGLLYAQGNGIVVISCDLQDPPALILDFIREWEAGADIVWGVRTERIDPGLKSLYANTFYWLLRKTTWSDFPPGGMDYGLFDRRVVQHYNKLPVRNSNPFFTVYNMGFKQAQLPYKREARRHGTGNWPFFKRVKNAIDVLVDFSYFPIRAISILGFAVALISTGYAAFVILYQVLINDGVAGWPSMIVVTSLLGSIQLLVLGVLGEYIWRVAEQSRERPRFLIMNRVGFEQDATPTLPTESYLPHAHHKDA